MTSNQIAYAQTVETQRHNRENERHDREIEKLQSESNKIAKWRAGVDTAGAVVGAVSTVGKIGTDITSTVLKNKEIDINKRISDANLALRAKEISNNWNVNLIHEFNVAQANANTLMLGMARNFVDYGNLQENIRSNVAQESLKSKQIQNDFAIQALKIGNDYSIARVKAQSEAANIAKDKYIAQLNNLNELERLNIERAKLEQNERLAEEKNKTTKKAAWITGGLRFAGNALGSAVSALKFVIGL